MNKQDLIKRCITLAKRARGLTSPNPLVGAVLVKNGQIISEDYHKIPGTPHAEVLVINKASKKAKGASLYVNLEPCCHKGKRTPPCTDLILQSGIKEVIISMKDPNPRVSGRGIRILKKAGIKMEVGIIEADAKRLNESYIKYITTKRPFVILKIAMTLDGKIATPAGESKWISGEKSRRLVHGMRGHVDGVLTAIGTVKADNPRLTSRIKGGRNPVRILIDPLLMVPIDSNIVKTPPRTIIITKNINKKADKLCKSGVEFIGYKDLLDMNWLMEELGKREITSIMIEGGSSLTGHAIEENIVDKVIFFIAPKIIGGEKSYPVISSKGYRPLSNALEVREIKTKKIGDDLLIEGYL